MTSEIQKLRDRLGACEADTARAERVLVSASEEYEDAVQRVKECADLENKCRRDLSVALETHK